MPVVKIQYKGTLEEKGVPGFTSIFRSLSRANSKPNRMVVCYDDDNNTFDVTYEFNEGQQLSQNSGLEATCRILGIKLIEPAGKIRHRNGGNS